MTLLKSIGRKLELDRAGVWHALQLAIAAAIAFSIAAILHLHYAYWAAMPVWVVAQSTRGLLLERALFRIVGTFLGVGYGFLVLHHLPQPHLQLAAFGVWIALCSGLTHLLRGVHAYGALMSGITAAVIILPSVLHPEHSMERAVARVECTLIGVAVVTLVTGFLTPSSGRLAFYRRVRQLAGDAVDFADASIRGSATPAQEWKLLTQIKEVDTEASLVSSGSMEGYRRLGHVHALTAASLDVMAAGIALADRQETEDRTISTDLQHLAQQLREGKDGKQPWLDTEWIKAAPPRLGQALNQLREADRLLFNDPQAADAKSFRHKAVYLAPHHDWALARRTALTCGATAFVASSVAFAWGSPSGWMTAMGVTIFSIILSSAPLPHKLAPKMLAGILIGVIAAMLYRLTIQPHLATTIQLILSLFPFFLVGSLARASRRITIAALEGTMCFMFISQAGMPAAAPLDIFTSGGAIIVGALLVTGTFILLPRKPTLQAKKEIELIARDLTHLAQSPEPDWQPHTARQILRLIIHLERATESKNTVPRGLLSPLNLGHAVMDLHAAAPLENAQTIQTALQTLSKFAEDPSATALKLQQHADLTDKPTIAFPLLDAAHALHHAAHLFRPSSPH